MTRTPIALLLALAALSASRLARADASTPPASPPASHHNEPAANLAGAINPIELASLQRTACYGTCPIYKVTIYVDGRVEFDGEEFVKEKGHRTGHASAADLAALRKAFADAGYTKLGDHYDCYDATDNPSANTSFVSGGHKKAVTHYYGCTSAPKALFAVEDAVDRAAHVEKWVGTEKERESLRRAGKLR